MWDMKTESALEKSRAYAAIWRDKNREKYNEYHRKIQYRYNPKLNAISREAYKLAGGYKVYREKTGDERLELRRVAEKNILLDTAPADKVMPFISPEREFGPYLPMTSYKSTERIGTEVPDGPVYVVQNPLTPHIQKVGKTFTNGIAAILSAARRFGPAILIYEQWFPLAFEAEQAVHKILEPYNLRKLRGPNPETGLYDCGVELFECSVETVLKAIEEVSIDTRKKQEMD
jgi:hypothetical protein